MLEPDVPGDIFCKQINKRQTKLYIVTALKQYIICLDTLCIDKFINVKSAPHL